MAGVVIPVYEFVVYPVLRKHFSWVKSYNKFIVLVLLQMIRVVILMVFVIKVRYVHLKYSDYNTTIPCILQEEHETFNLSLTPNG